MLSWIPLIGPIIDGLVSIFTKKMDTTVQVKTIEAGQEKVLVQSSQQTLTDFKDDIGIRIIRDALLVPIIVWTDLIVWDKIIELRHPDWVWGVKPLTDATGIEFLPYAAITFLLGWAAMKSFKR